MVSYGKQFSEERTNDEIGNIAVTLSHIKIYDLMIKNNIERACILEDDATLLPTFPEVLKIAPKLQWDILRLASDPHTPKSLKESIYSFHKRCSLFLYRLVKRYNILKPIGHRIKYSLENYDIEPFNIYRLTQSQETLKRLLEEYHIDPYLYPRQSERFSKILEEHSIRFEKIRKDFEKVGKIILYDATLNYYIAGQFGGLPERNSLKSINEYHSIAKPKTIPYSASAYLVNSSAAMKWKHLVLSNSAFSIDHVPWELYKNGQVKLRIITPPCAHSTYQYFMYSVRCR